MIHDFMLPAVAQPLLSQQLSFIKGSGKLIVNAPESEYTFSGHSAVILSRLEQRLDGTCKVGDLAYELGISAEELGATLGMLAVDDLLLDASAALQARAPVEFLTAYLKECRFWSKHIFIQPFWSALLSGQAAPSLIFGWGIEFYHYVEAANEHMAAAIAHCHYDDQIRQQLAEHYVEEFDHSEIFLHGLSTSGFNIAQVKSAMPLASTRALINYLNELAISDTLCYAATFGVMQAAGEGTTKEGINQFYDLLSEHYPFARGLCDAIRKHALIDVELEHQALIIEQILSQMETVSVEDAQRIISAVKQTAEHFIFFFEGIHDYYRAPAARVPRPTLDIRTVM